MYYAFTFLVFFFRCWVAVVAAVKRQLRAREQLMLADACDGLHDMLWTYKAALEQELQQERDEQAGVELASLAAEIKEDKKNYKVGKTKSGSKVVTATSLELPVDDLRTNEPAVVMRAGAAVAPVTSGTSSSSSLTANAQKATAGTITMGPLAPPRFIVWVAGAESRRSL